MDEALAQRVVLVQAFDASDSPLWTREDAAWATRLALQGAAPDAPIDRLLGERARHALKRLEPRDRDVRRWLARPQWRALWIVLASLLGVVIGLAVDLFDRRQIVNVLAPSVWAVVAWNAGVYLALALAALHRRAPSPARSAGLRGLVLQWWLRGLGSGPVRAASARWADMSAPLALTRVAALLHVAAAAVAIGLIGSLYLRGLVLDFRAGWQSTFLDAASVRQVLSVLLSPASALTAIAIPDAATLESMRLTTPAQAASAPAAPWIHLFAATLGWAVVVPRLLLAVLDIARAAYRARRFVLPLDDPALARAAQQLRRHAARVQVCPYAQAPGAQAGLGLRALLVREFGDDLQLQIAATTAIGDEQEAARRLSAEGVTLRVLLVDLAATPEDDHHGCFMHALREAAPQLPLLLVVDESAYRQRFASVPDRIVERRAAWRRWAADQGLGLRSAPLDDAQAGAAPAPQPAAS